MSLRDICKYRTIWMGLAILWVIFFHADILVTNRAINAIKTFGYGGVDIFIFASGIGCYHSYFRDSSPLDFLRRRLLRLGPSYIPFIIVWIILGLYSNNLDISSSIGNLFAIQGFTSNGHDFNWYLTGMIICYLLTPYIASYIKANSNSKAFLLVLFLVVLSIAFWKDSRLIISMSRVPLFVIGMIVEKNADQKISKKELLIGGVCFLLGWGFLICSYVFANSYLWDFGLWWYPFVMIVPFLCVLISVMFVYLEKIKVGRLLKDILTAIGEISFELYLIHIFVFSYSEKIIRNVGFDCEVINWLLLFVTVILLSLILNWISKKLRTLFIEKQDKKVRG